MYTTVLLTTQKSTCRKRTRWTWVWPSSGSRWWTGKPGMLQSTGWQRVRHDWATELNWPEEENDRAMPLNLLAESFRSRPDFISLWWAFTVYLLGKPNNLESSSRPRMTLQSRGQGRTRPQQWTGVTQWAHERAWPPAQDDGTPKEPSLRRPGKDSAASSPWGDAFAQSLLFSYMALWVLDKGQCRPPVAEEGSEQARQKD